MAIYTRRGDRGKTSLYNGDRRSKDNWRICTLGAIDELNSQLGFALSLLARRSGRLKNILRQVQQDLFEIAAELAAASGKTSSIAAKRVRELERMIDSLEVELPVLANFIFPGGSAAGAALHVARSVCRRAERELVALSKKEKVSTDILAYLNRLSDLLFMLARKINSLEKQPEELWKRE